MATFFTLKGKKKNMNVTNHRVDWDGKSLSKFQFNVKQFLRKYWSKHIVYEEFPVAGTRMHIDIYNATLKVAIECDGSQHSSYNKFFHNGSLTAYRRQLERDGKKEKWCELNDITLIRLTEEDAPNLSREWMKQQCGIDIVNGMAIEMDSD